MSLPTNRIKKITASNGTSYDIVPLMLQNSGFSAELPALTADSTLALTKDLDSYLPLSAGSGKPLTGSIYYSGGGRSAIAIRFKDGDANGTGVIIGDGGLVHIGAGESANASNDTTWGYTGGTENLYLTADGSIYFGSNCNTIANRNVMTYNTGGNLLVPGVVQASHSASAWNGVEIDNSGYYFGNSSTNEYDLGTYKVLARTGNSSSNAAAWGMAIATIIPAGTSNMRTRYSTRQTTTAGGTSFNEVYFELVAGMTNNAANRNANILANFRPASTDTYTLGTSSQKWKELYVSGTANIGNTTLSNSATSAVTVTLPSSTGTLMLANSAITGATKCKITYDSKGLVTAGANLSASDMPNLNASKITAGTFADARIASADTWNQNMTKTLYYSKGTVNSNDVTVVAVATGRILTLKFRIWSGVQTTWNATYMRISVTNTNLSSNGYTVNLGNLVDWFGGSDYVSTAVGHSTHYNQPFTFHLRINSSRDTLLLYTDSSITMPVNNMLDITFDIPLKDYIS